MRINSHVVNREFLVTQGTRPPKLYVLTSNLAPRIWRGLLDFWNIRKLLLHAIYL